MADRRDIMVRFGTLTMAALFLITSVAFTAVIFWQANQDDKADDLTAEQQQLVDDALNNQEGEDMLQGTILAGFTPITTPVTELQVIDLVEGTGEEIKAEATVTAHYTGAYAVNGEIFQSSHDGGQPFTSPLSGLIEGWQEGIPGMKVGGKRRLVIPGAKAYGEAPEGYTPGSTDSPMGPLVFDIEVLSAEQ